MVFVCDVSDQQFKGSEMDFVSRGKKVMEQMQMEIWNY